MRIETLLSEAPVVLGPGRPNMVGGANAEERNRIRNPSKPVFPPTPLQGARKSSGPKRLMKGMKDSSNPKDLIGKTFTNRPRESITNSNQLMKAYDTVALTNIPLLHGTAPRSNALIATLDWGIAVGFGDVAMLNVTKQTTPYTWIYSDFNMINTLKKAMSVLQQFDRKTYKETLDFDQMDKLYNSDSNQATMFKGLSGFNGTPTQYFCKQFTDLIDQGKMGVARSIDEIPDKTEEVWFQGTMEVIGVND